MAEIAVLCDSCAAAKDAARKAAADALRLRMRFEDLRKHSAVPPEFFESNWETSRADIEALNPSVWSQGRSWVTQTRRNLYVHGPVGVGKTRLARCCLHEAFVAGYSVAEVSARRLCKVSDTYREGDGIYDRWKSVSFLLLDDINKARWTLERIDALWELLDARTSGRRRTIVTGNVDPGSLVKLLRSGCQTGGPADVSHADAALDRLKPCLTLSMVGHSQRGVEDP